MGHIFILKSKNGKNGLHLVELAAVNSASDSLGNDDTRQDQVLQDTLVNGSEGSASGSHLGLVSLDPLGLDVALGNEEHAGLELLLHIEHDFFVDLLQ